MGFFVFLLLRVLGEQGKITNMELDFSHLNKQQKKAVEHENGPMLIVAGAGTGKTTAITYKLANLIKQKNIKSDEILALTFTDKAAEEMEQRVDRLLPYGYVDLWVCTFHSFCKRILQEHALDIGLSNDFKLLDQTAGWLLIRQNLDKFDLDYYKPLGNPTKFIHALIAHFSRCKDQVIYPKDYLKYREQFSIKNQKQDDEEEQRIQEVANAYQVYQNLLLENNLLDFGDLIGYCLKLFKKRPNILKEYREKFKYILVDEFQDTNFIQYELVKLLAAPENNLTVTADDDQAIYRFRGASFGNIVQFIKDFPNTEQIILKENYRSTQNILDLSYGFIQQNNPNRLEYLNKINKKLISDKKEKGIVEHLYFKRLEQEARGVVNKIIELCNKDKELNWNDFAILVRANNHANIFSGELERANLPYQFMALKGLYSKPVILDIISYFKLLDNYYESSAVYRILNLPFLKIPENDIAKITQYSIKKSHSIYESLQELSLIPNLSEKAINQINYILGLIKKHTILASQKKVSEVFISFLKDSGYLEYLTKKEAGDSIKYINQLFDKIKNFEQENIDPSLRNFMQELELELESGEQGKLSFDMDQGPDMIRLMTIHAAKGLEFKYVFLVNLVDKRFPSIERKEPIKIPNQLVKDIIPEGDIHIQEERRLFYVAMTRAKKGLFFVSSEDYGGARKKKLSRFLKELNYDILSKEKIYKKEQEYKDLVSPSFKGKKEEKIILPNHVSFSQLRAFETCPYQYKFAHIFKIPVRGKAVFSYGKTMHNTLEKFIKYLYEDSPGKENKLFEKLIEIYKKEWIDDWYDSQKQKQQYFENGKKALIVFYDNFMENKPLVLLINNKPAIEKKFNLKINGNTLIGKIDRIDKIGGGVVVSDTVELVDYKTGKFKEKLDSKEKEQLLIYQLAAQQVFKLKPKKLTYYYLDEGKKLSFLGTEQDLEKQEQKIIDQIKQMKKSDFSATPGWHCKFCDFKDICECVQK
ncbi:MAG: UvrD-helicase domain-containing protein [Candidatus Pacebacteria bacterium]|nr:UvrD-helicase domain-containing protein [Candidatus Paceibacterota bacterium]